MSKCICTGDILWTMLMDDHLSTNKKKKEIENFNQTDVSH